MCLAPAHTLTWLPLAFLHPDGAVVLCHARLGVQEGQAYAALGTEASVVAAAVLDGLLVELVAEPDDTQAEETHASPFSTDLQGSPLSTPFHQSFLLFSQI